MGYPLTSVPHGTSGRRREKRKRCRGSKRTRLSLISSHRQGRKNSRQRERGDVENPTRARMPFSPRRIGREDDGNSFTSEFANSLARLHCNIELEQNKPSVLINSSTRVYAASVSSRSHFPPKWTRIQHPLPLTRTNYSSPTFYVTAPHKVYITILLSFISRCPHTASFSSVLTMGSSFNIAWVKAPSGL